MKNKKTNKINQQKRNLKLANLNKKVKKKIKKKIKKKSKMKNKKMKKKIQITKNLLKSYQENKNEI